jgi:hypothetical protein
MDNTRTKYGLEQYIKVLDNHIAQTSCLEGLGTDTKNKKVESLELHKASVLKELEGLEVA